MITTVEQFVNAAPLTAAAKSTLLKYFGDLDELECWLSNSNREKLQGVADKTVQALLDTWESVADQIAPAEPGGDSMPAEPVHVMNPSPVANSKPDLSRLSDFFPGEDIEWKPVAIKKQSRRGLFVPYITNRAVQQRLDDVFGVDGWRNEFRRGPDGGVICRIYFRVNGEWIWKEDGAENSDIEPVKGGLSNSMRRAAVQLGIGRYLYKADQQWLPVDDRGRPLQRPVLPASMLPGNKVPERWANERELVSTQAEAEEDQYQAAQMFDNKPNARPPARNGRASNGQVATQRGGAAKPVGAMMPNIQVTDVPDPDPNMVTGDYPKFAPGPENWSWAMPEGAKRKDTSGVTNKDLEAFSKHYKKWGWGADAIADMLYCIFKARRFSALSYAEFCGIWQLVTYKEAYLEFMGRAAHHRALREAERAMDDQ